MPVGIVAHEVAVVEPHHAAHSEPALQLLFYLGLRQGLITMGRQQALRGGEERALPVGIDGTALEHEVLMVFVACFSHKVQALPEFLGNPIVPIGQKFLAPAVEAEVEPDGRLRPFIPFCRRRAHQNDGTEVARPSVVIWQLYHHDVLRRVQLVGHVVSVHREDDHLLVAGNGECHLRHGLADVL